jgi:hypothetical protein
MIRRKKTVDDDYEPEDIKKMLADFIKGFWLVIKVLLVALIISPFFISSQGKGFLAKGISYVVDIDSICQPCLCDAPDPQKGPFDKKDGKAKDMYKGMTGNL